MPELATLLPMLVVLLAIGAFYLICVAFTIVWSRKQYKEWDEETAKENSQD